MLRAQPVPQFWGGRAEVSPTSAPEAALVLNQTLTARLPAAVALFSTRPVSAIWEHELTWPGVVHQAPSSGMNELVPLNPVAVTPATGPAAPRVVLNSA